MANKIKTKEKNIRKINASSNITYSVGKLHELPKIVISK